MEAVCPVCGGSGLVVFQLIGDGGEREQDQPCAECGQTGRLKGSRARRLTDDKIGAIHSRLIARRFGSHAHRWMVR